MSRLRVFDLLLPLQDRSGLCAARVPVRLEVRGLTHAGRFAAAAALLELNHQLVTASAISDLLGSRKLHPAVTRWLQCLKNWPEALVDSAEMCVQPTEDEEAAIFEAAQSLQDQRRRISIREVARATNLPRPVVREGLRTFRELEAL